MPKHCFVIGPIGPRDSPIRVHADDFIKFIVVPVLKRLDFDDPVRADQMDEPGRITTQIIREINEADLVIADLTSGNPNVYYELSLRHAIGKPVIHMALETTELPFDIADNRTILFDMHARRVEEAKETLSRQINHVLTGGYKPTNPIIEAIDIIQLRGSAQPMEQQMGRLMTQVDALSANVATLQTAVTRLGPPTQLTMSSFPPAANLAGFGPPGFTEVFQTPAGQSNQARKGISLK